MPIDFRDIIIDCCTDRKSGDTCQNYNPYQNRGVCESELLDICGGKMNDSKCQQICTARIGSYSRNLCSKLLDEYCKNNSEDPNCACHMPDSHYDKIKQNIIDSYPPETQPLMRLKLQNKPGQCFDMKCLNLGESWKKDGITCPQDINNFVTCVQKIAPNVLSTSSVKMNASQAQECGININADGDTTTYQGSGFLGSGFGFGSGMFFLGICIILILTCLFMFFSLGLIFII